MKNDLFGQEKLQEADSILPNHHDMCRNYLSTQLLSTLFFILIVWLTGCQPVPAPTTEPLIVAHRGAMSERPENTMPAYRHAAVLGADIIEIDLRTSRDGHLFIFHDATLDRTTNGEGSASEREMEELRELDAGSWFSPEFSGEQIPLFEEVLQWAASEEIALLLDLKESGLEYARKVADNVHRHGDGGRVVVGVRSPEQAAEFRELLPDSLQLAFIGSGSDIEAFTAAGVDIIRLWLHWLEENPSLADQVRDSGRKLMINGSDGNLEEVQKIMSYSPDWILIDDLDQLYRSLEELQ